jgi:hypothetical protein
MVYKTWPRDMTSVHIWRAFQAMVIQRKWVSGVRALYLIDTPCMINVGPTMHSVLRIVESLKAKDVGLKRVLMRMRLTCMKLFPKVCSSM